MGRRKRHKHRHHHKGGYSHHQESSDGVIYMEGEFQQEQSEQEKSEEEQWDDMSEEALLDAQIVWCLEEIQNIVNGPPPHLFKDGVWQRWFKNKQSYAKELIRYAEAKINNPKAHQPIATDYQAGQGQWSGRGWEPGTETKKPDAPRSWSWTPERKWGPKLPLTPKLPAPTGLCGVDHFVM